MSYQDDTTTSSRPEADDEFGAGDFELDDDLDPEGDTEWDDEEDEDVPEDWNDNSSGYL